MFGGKKSAVVISGPSGAGKTTVINLLLQDELFKHFLILSVSHTTRKKRKGEKHGKDYYFVSREEFEKLIEEGEFMEWAEVHGNLYGTSKENFRKAKREGKILILDIDVQGAKNLRKMMKDEVLTIFLKPPSFTELKRRLERRGDTSSGDIKIRLKNAREEMKHEKEFDIVVINKELSETVRKIKDILIDVVGIEKIVSHIFEEEGKAKKKAGVDARKNLKELLKKLISIKSVTGEEKELGEFIFKKLREIGFSVEKQYIEKGKRERFNILAKGSGNPEILFSAHIDTVPELGMKSAFLPVEKNGRIYGRGSADTKGAIAGFLFALELYKRLMGKIPPIYICFTVDEEEWSSLGSFMALKKIPPTCKSAVIFEPTELKICTAEEGSFEFKLEVEVGSAHASRFEDYTNPAKLLFEIIDKMEKKFRRKVNIIEFRSGWKFYAIPKNAYALCEIKVKKGEKRNSIEREISKILKEALLKNKNKDLKNISFEVVDYENFIEFGESKASDLIRKSFEILGMNTETSIMPSWTDAANFSKKVKCVVFGPGKIDDCHTERENVSVEELKKFTKIIFTTLYLIDRSQAR